MKQSPYSQPGTGDRENLERNSKDAERTLKAAVYRHTEIRFQVCSGD
jgi:hypothetical protein